MILIGVKGAKHHIQQIGGAKAHVMADISSRVRDRGKLPILVSAQAGYHTVFWGSSN